MIGVGAVKGNRNSISQMKRPTGAMFGPDFDPGADERENWGSLEIEFEDCDTAVASWVGPAAFGSGSVGLQRLTSIDDVGCDASAVQEPDRVISGRSGAWFDPGHDGEGWMLEVLPNGNVVAYWFTYDDQGRQAWKIGITKIEGRTLWIEDMMITRGGAFWRGIPCRRCQI